MGRGPNVTAAEKEVILRRRAEGATIEAVAAEVGRHPTTVDKVVAAAGGLPPRHRRQRAGTLCLEEREEISRALRAAQRPAEIARALGRHRSTITREIAANGGPEHYRAWAAERRAHHQARRPKLAKLKANPALRAEVVAGLRQRWSPQQIARSLRKRHPHDPRMWVSHETIYQSLFVQGRGALRKELATCLRKGRARRRSQAGAANRRGQLQDMVLISERPAEVEDRAVPGHWEGDLLVGKGGSSAIATLVERHTRYVMLAKIQSQRAEDVRVALARLIRRLPTQLAKSLTWDQGKEMAEHRRFSVDTGVAVYFCDPHSPWQRGSNENTNGLLRQYFPKGTDLSVHSQQKLDGVARQLNGRPRETLDWDNPAERLAAVVAATG